ncbi:MAG: nitroreductase family protein [Sphaerochaetaceae bacterium]|jgi:nitroreductase
MRSIEDFIYLLHERYSSKLYTDEPIGDEELSLILEAGRLSPSSFGFEGWEFHVVRTPKQRVALSVACFDQESVVTAPISIVLVAHNTESFKLDSPFVAQRGSRYDEPLEVFIDDYKGYYDFLIQEERLEMWSRSQCYIAAANMVNAAAIEGIQSCIIEGFDEQLVLDILRLNPKEFLVSLVITFGYPADPFRKKIREPLESLVSYH